MDDELEGDANYDVDCLNDISENEYEKDDHLFGDAPESNVESLRDASEQRSLNTDDDQDTTDYYDMNEMPPPPTTDIYPDVESAERAMNNFSLQYGYSIVKLRSVSRQGKRFRIQYECSRGRVRSTVTNESRRRSKVSSRLNCPFRANLRLERKNGEWKDGWILSIRNPHHNHPPSVESNPLTLRKSYLQKHRAVVIKLLREGLAITEILKRLSELDSSVTLQKWDISNLRTDLEYQSTKNFTPYEVLTMRFPKTGDGFIDFVTGLNSTHGVFMLHKTGLELLACYHQVLFIDRTLKDNKFKTPVLTISSALPNGKTFFVGIAFLKGDLEQACKYMLTNLRHTYRELKLPDPLTIFTERDLFMMKAIRQVFPGTNNILSQVHAKSNFFGAARIILSTHLSTRDPSLLEDPEKFQLQAKAHEDSLMVRWNRVIAAPTMEHFIKARDAFTQHYRGTVKLIEYIETTWLCPDVIQCLAPCFTDSYFNMGFKSMVRISSINERLKDLLYNNSLDLLSACKEFEMTVAAHNLEMHQELFSEKAKAMKVSSPSFYSGLPSGIIFHGSDQIVKLQSKYLPTGSEGKQAIVACTGTTYRSLGLPCIHHILAASAKGAQPLTADDFHPFWHSISETSRQYATKLIGELTVLDHVKFRVRVRHVSESTDSGSKEDFPVSGTLNTRTGAQSVPVATQTFHPPGQSKHQHELQQQQQRQPIMIIHQQQQDHFHQQDQQQQQQKQQPQRLQQLQQPQQPQQQQQQQQREEHQENRYPHRLTNEPLHHSQSQHHPPALPQSSPISRMGRQTLFDIQTPDSIMRATAPNPASGMAMSTMGMLNPLHQQQLLRHPQPQHQRQSQHEQHRQQPQQLQEQHQKPRQ